MKGFMGYYERYQKRRGLHNYHEDEKPNPTMVGSKERKSTIDPVNWSWELNYKGKPVTEDDTDTTRDLPKNKAEGTANSGTTYITPSSERLLKLEREFKDDLYVIWDDTTDSLISSKSAWNWILAHAKEIGNLI